MPPRASWSRERKARTGIFIGAAPGGVDVSNSGQITYASDTGSGIAGSGLGGDARIVNSGSIVKLGAGAGAAGIVASHTGASGTLTLDNQGSIASQGGTLSIGMQGIAMGSGGVALLNAGTIGSVSAPVTYALNGSVSAATATLTANNSGHVDAELGGITALSEGGFNITNSGTIAESAANAITLAGAGALGGTVSNSGSLLARSRGVLSQSTGSLTLSNSGTIRAPEAISATAGAVRDQHGFGPHRGHGAGGGRSDRPEQRGPVDQHRQLRAHQAVK